MIASAWQSVSDTLTRIVSARREERLVLCLRGARTFKYLAGPEPLLPASYPNVRLAQWPRDFHLWRQFRVRAAAIADAKREGFRFRVRGCGRACIALLTSAKSPTTSTGYLREQPYGVRDFRASVKRYPRAILSTPGTSGYDISYKRVLRATPPDRV